MTKMISKGIMSFESETFMVVMCEVSRKNESLIGQGGEMECGLNGSEKRESCFVNKDNKMSLGAIQKGRSQNAGKF